MTSRIVICDWCNGSGKQEQRECTDYHHNDYNEWDDPCAWCDGLGRRVEEVKTRKMTKAEIELRPKPKEASR